MSRHDIINVYGIRTSGSARERAAINEIIERARNGEPICDNGHPVAVDARGNLYSRMRQH